MTTLKRLERAAMRLYKVRSSGDFKFVSKQYQKIAGEFDRACAAHAKTPMELADEIERDADYRLELEGNPVFTKVRLERDALAEQNKKFAEELASREALLREVLKSPRLVAIVYARRMGRNHAESLLKRIEQELGETS